MNKRSIEHEKKQDLVISYLAAGFNFKEIADIFHIRIDTANNLVSRMKKKYECRTTTQLVVKYLSIRKFNNAP